MYNADGEFISSYPGASLDDYYISIPAVEWLIENQEAILEMSAGVAINTLALAIDLSAAFVGGAVGGAVCLSNPGTAAFAVPAAISAGATAMAVVHATVTANFFETGNRMIESGAKKLANPADVSDAASFERKISKMSPNERVAAIKTKAKQIASEKGFIQDKRLTKINNRTVYRDPKTNNLYAVDYQHGRFELVNGKTGQHMGEYNFDFELTKSADITGGHNLFVK